MQTFKQFLAESRTQVVGVEDFIKWADANASVYMNGPHFLYRGGSGTSAKGLRVGNSTKADRPRQSANTYNNYTLWIDNHPAFKGWPKRSLAWIATDNREVAEGFGGAALLIVHDEAPVGVVGHNDLWETPVAIKSSRIELTIEELNGITQQMLGEKYSKSFEELSANLKAHTIEDVRKNAKDNEFYEVMVEAILQVMEKNKYKNMFDLWNHAVVPGIFAGKTAGAQVSDKQADGEVWIEGEVGFIPHSSRLSDADAKRLLEWADQYPELLNELHSHWSEDADNNWEDE